MSHDEAIYTVGCYLIEIFNCICWYADKV